MGINFFTNEWQYKTVKVPHVIGLITLSSIRYVFSINHNDNNKHPTKSSTITIFKDMILWNKDYINFILEPED